LYLCSTLRDQLDSVLTWSQRWTCFVLVLVMFQSVPFSDQACSSFTSGRSKTLSYSTDVFVPSRNFPASLSLWSDEGGSSVVFAGINPGQKHSEDRSSGKPPSTCLAASPAGAWYQTLLGFLRHSLASINGPGQGLEPLNTSHKLRPHRAQT